MNNCVKTKFLPCTNTKGDRITATLDGVTLTMPYNYAGCSLANHRWVAVKLALALGKECDLINITPHQRGYSFIIV